MMSDESQLREQGNGRGELALSDAAAAEWLRHVEPVLRGVAHALNNRAAALAALIELSTEPAEAPGVLRDILHAEQQRVQELVRVVRLVGTPRGQEEAFVPAEVAEEMRPLLDLHADLRDGGVQIAAGEGSPIRTYRWAFARVLLVMAVRLLSMQKSAAAALVITTDGDWVVIAPDNPRVDGPPGPLLSELARVMDGETLVGTYGVRVPTLVALRRREGR